MYMILNSLVFYNMFHIDLVDIPKSAIQLSGKSLARDIHLDVFRKSELYLPLLQTSAALSPFTYLPYQSASQSSSITQVMT